ncbi:MAG: thiamine/thiamine pyrophosphate ABC transporter permease ThiP [Rhodobacteraceae bacterium]|nr:thiamine/thiamine pyrophosphate ABC transporter permease ThiP [Paracoccaceae bacterium]
MVKRIFKLTRPTLAGGLALTLVLGLITGTLLAVGLRAEFTGGFGPSDWSAVRFTLLQASLSAMISVGLAVPVARALSRRSFPFRHLLIILMGAPFVLPVMVAVLGLLAVFGRAGMVNSALIWAGLEPVSIYGLQGVVLAHVFFNLPLATRLILQGWQDIPGERFRLAASLGFSTRDVGRLLERPMLRTVLPGALLVVFLVCLTSFAVALTMGGGPRATTIELAIYQAVRLDFDLGKAAYLALVQMGLGLTAAMLALRFGLPGAGFGAGLDHIARRWEAEQPVLRVIDTALIILAALFLIIPLSMVVWNGLPGIAALPTPVWVAALRSLGVALAATAISLILAISIAALSVLNKLQVVGSLGMLGIAASPLVIGTGLFIVIHPLADPALFALPVTAMVNALMALPFVLRILLPALTTTEADFGRLADGLGVDGFARLRLLWLPRLRRPLGFGAGLTAALSMGDLGVVALFAAPDQATLPLQLYRLMGAYRMQDAAAAGLLLLCLSLALFWLFDRGGGARA